MNRAETLLVNSPPRAWLQRFYEVPLLRRLGGPLPGGNVLEIGCGRGVGTELIFEKFGAERVTAFDLDPGMVSRAQKRLARFGDRASLSVGDATDIKADDNTYDAVFDFAIVHHVPQWRDAVAEVARVLRPGGRFYFEEVTSHALARPSYRMLFDHPSEDRFSGREFVDELRRHGLETGVAVRERFFGDYVLGAATLQSR